MMENLTPEQSKALMYTTLAGVGGILGYIYRETKASRKVKVFQVLLRGAIAAFIGYHMISVYYWMGLPEEVIGAVNGLSALLGVEFILYLFERIVMKKLGLSYEQRVTEALISAGWQPPANSGGLVHDVEANAPEI